MSFTDSFNIFNNQCICDCTCRHLIRHFERAYNVNKSGGEKFRVQSIHNINDINKHNQVIEKYNHYNYVCITEFFLKNYTENEAKYISSILYKCNCCPRHQKNKPHYLLF